VLLEALIAVMIFSFAVLGIIGLQAAMVKNTSEAKYRAEAAHIAQQKIGEMWSHPTANEMLVDIGTTQIADLPNGSRTVKLTTPPSQYTVRVTWQEPGSPQHNFTTIATINNGSGTP
jgi:type IV pilus assembly protein PilV